MIKVEYIDLRYKPDRNDLVVEYYLEPNKISLEKAADTLAGESSIGSWDKIKTLTPEIAKRLKPSIFYINKKDRIIKVAYTSELFESGNMPGILASIAGNIFGMRAIKNLRLEDISFPKSIVKSFKGPQLGIQGIRNKINVKKRALIGTIVKPKVGLNEKEHAKVAYESWIGGLDLVKADENLTSMKFNKFEDRVIKTLEMRDKAEEETGEKKIYVENVTAETNEMIRRAEFIKKNDGNCCMIDIVVAGWSSLQTLREANLGLIIHAHRSGHGMFTENKKHGMSMLAVAKIARLIGVDQIHIGAVYGKMKSVKNDVVDIKNEIEKRFIVEDRRKHILEQKWYNIKPIFAICSGGLYPGVLPKLIEVMGNNIICQAGAGVHAHPLGTVAGAKATRQAIDAYYSGIDLKEYSKQHKELEVAIKRWGYLK